MDSIQTEEKYLKAYKLKQLYASYETVAKGNGNQLWWGWREHNLIISIEDGDVHEDSEYEYDNKAEYQNNEYEEQYYDWNIGS